MFEKNKCLASILYNIDLANICWNVLKMFIPCGLSESLVIPTNPAHFCQGYYMAAPPSFPDPSPYPSPWSAMLTNCCYLISQYMLDGLLLNVCFNPVLDGWHVEEGGNDGFLWEEETEGDVERQGQVRHTGRGGDKDRWEIPVGREETRTGETYWQGRDKDRWEILAGER